MITKMEVNNINSINHCSISFEKAKYKYLNDMIFNNELVNPISFYGTNGSGKSSLLNAFSTLIALLTLDVNDLYAFTPNIINTNVMIEKEIKKHPNISHHRLKFLNNKIRSSILITFKLNENNYEYFIETNYEFITKEYLKYKNQKIFSRHSFQYTYEDNNIKMRENLYPMLRKLANEDIDSNIIKDAYNFLSNIAFIDATRKNYLLKSFNNKSYKDILVEYSKDVKDLLKKYKEFPLYTIEKESTELGQKYYLLNLALNGQKNVQMPLNYISSGMENNSLLLSTVLSLPNNGVLIIDEIEQALHPLTILDFLKIIKDKNIQLIFSSHNTFILQKLRPDQIFFANWNNGYSTYKKLADIYPNIREVNNIEKMYLSSLFDEEITKDE